MPAVSTVPFSWVSLQKSHHVLQTPNEPSEKTTSHLVSTIFLKLLHINSYTILQWGWITCQVETISVSRWRENRACGYRFLKDTFDSKKTSSLVTWITEQIFWKIKCAASQRTVRGGLDWQLEAVFLLGYEHVKKCSDLGSKWLHSQGILPYRSLLYYIYIYDAICKRTYIQVVYCI